MYLQVLVIFCCCVISNFCSSYPDPRGSGRASPTYTSEGELDSPNSSEVEYRNYQPQNLNGVGVYNNLHPSLAGSGTPNHSENPKPKIRKPRHRHGKRPRVTQKPKIKKLKRRRNKKRPGPPIGEIPEDPHVPPTKNPDLSSIGELTHIPQPQGTDVPAIQKPKEIDDLKQVDQNKKIPEDPHAPPTKNPDLSSIGELTHIPQPQGTDVPAIQKPKEIKDLEQVDQNKNIGNHLRPDQGTDFHLRPDQGTDFHLRPDQGTDFHLRPDQGTDFHLRPDQGTDFHLRPDQGTDFHLRPDQGTDFHLRPDQGTDFHLRPNPNFPKDPEQGNRFPEGLVKETRFPKTHLQGSRFPDIDWKINHRRNRTSVDGNPEETPCPELETQTVVPPYPECGKNPDRNNKNHVNCQDKHGHKHGNNVNQGCGEPKDPEWPAIQPPLPNDRKQGNNLIDCNDQLTDPNLGDYKEIHIPEEILQPGPDETTNRPFSLHEFGHKIVHGLFGGGIRKSAQLKVPGLYLDSHSTLGDGHLYKTQKSFDVGLVRGNLGLQLF